MAWINNRIYVHPKFLELTPKAGWTWTLGVAFSNDNDTHGYLSATMQEIVRSTPAARRELIDAQLWDDLGGGAILIHDWDDYNGKQDERRAKDRERKRKVRGQSAPVSAGLSAGLSADISADGRTDSHARAIAEVTKLRS